MKGKDDISVKSLPNDCSTYVCGVVKDSLR